MLNLTYDNWNEDTKRPYQPNAMDLYPNSFHMPYDSIINDYNVSEEFIFRCPIYDIKNHPSKVFFYFVTLMPNVIGYKLINNELPIPLDAIQQLRINKNFNVIIMNRQECENFETVKLLHIWSKSLGLNQKQIWIVNNNVKLYEYGEILKTNINLHIQRNLGIHGITSMRNSYGNTDFKPNKDGCLFLCHNRRARFHRYGILCLLKKYNILDDVDWSLMPDYTIDDFDSFYKSVFTLNDINNLSDEIEYFKNIKYKKSKYEENYNLFYNPHNIDWSITYDKNTFENSYFNITTETEFESDVIHISEKSLKAFYGMQFPLILATYGHIKELKKIYDFDWFDDIIDHSYDDEPDPRNRLFKFAKEVKRIHENKEFFIEFYKNNEDRFVSNYKKSIEWVDIMNNRDIEFIHNLRKISNLI